MTTVVVEYAKIKVEIAIPLMLAYLCYIMASQTGNYIHKNRKLYNTML